ncbi:MAG: tetratricopeptide repeat protein, partial [Planctomycetaceae bacterium]|nr:tetratricopeptide repeat protein [Planctomycetaceae bacterium]
PETEADRYRRQALSYYGAGMMYEQQGNRLEALKHYQRALRFDPNSAAVLRQIVEVAWSLERHQEAIRYALKAAEVGPANPELLERLAAYLAEDDKLNQAVDLYEKAAALKKGEEKSLGYVRLKMLIGQLYARLEDFGKASDAFEFVFGALREPDEYGLRGRAKQALEGEKGRSYYLFAESFLRANRIEPAEEAVAKAYEVGKNDALHAFYEARLAEERQEADIALEKLAAYFEAESDEAGTDAYELLKRLLKADDKSSELVPRLEGLVKEDPKNVPLKYFLAREYRELKQWDKAKPLYAELLRRQPTTEAYEGLLEAGSKTADPAVQLDVLSEVVAKTNSLDAIETPVEALAADEKLYSALVAAGRKAADKSEPEDGRPVAFAVGLVALKAKDYVTAGEFFELALLHDPKSAPAVFLSWGMGLLGDDQHDAAVKVFHRAVDENVTPDNPAFHTYLALSLEFAGKTDEALAMARKAAEFGEGALRFESRIPWILYHAKRYQEAAEAYQELIKKFDADHKSDEDRGLLREARLALSNIYVMLDDVGRAEQPLEEILDEFPDDVGALNDLGYIWADQNKNLGKSLEMVLKAVAKEPNNRAYRDSLGWVYYRLGRFPEAVVELELAVKGASGDEEPDGVILDHLGDALAGAGRVEEARKAWRRAEAFFAKADDKTKLAAVKKKLAERTSEKTK